MLLQQIISANNVEFIYLVKAHYYGMREYDSSSVDFFIERDLHNIFNYNILISGRKNTF